MNENTHVRFNLVIPKTHAKYIKRLSEEMTSPQMYIMRKVIKSWVEKKLMPRYPELAEGDVKANSDALDELIWPCVALCF